MFSRLFLTGVVWSHLYSYSFDANPGWTREYPTQEEILAYLIKVAQKWGLYQHILFNTQVEEATWDESSKQWSTVVKHTGGKDAEYTPSKTITSDALISGVGQLNVASFPEIPGLDTFQGKTMHSARWDWSYDFKDKRIAIIGTGATAAQIIPEIAKTARNITAFQRTPNWVIPRDDKPIGKIMQWIYRYLPAVRRRYRASLMDIRETLYDAAVVEDSPLNGLFKQLSLDMLARQVPNNEALRKSLTPNYPPGCKRVIISDDFFVAMNKSNVRLETEPIAEITSSGITAGGVSEDYDFIILATGFRTLEFMYPIKIVGREGRSIEDIWRSGATAYLGMTVEDLPNFAMLYGPNTNLGHNSIILMIEAQSRYINTLISTVLASKENGSPISIRPKPQRIKAYNAEIQERLQKSTFSSPNCRSWYKNADGIVTNNWCGTVVEYQTRTATIDWDDFVVSAAKGKQSPVEGKQYIGRVVEETRISTGTLVTTLLAAGTIVLATQYRTLSTLFS